MVEVFKTNVDRSELADQVILRLRVHFPSSKINFDLEDCDKILRIEDQEVCSDTIIDLLKTSGVECEALN
jgi:hypothetical protein